jgi:hypothetical protein
MHAGNRYGFLSRFSVVEGDHPTAVDAPGNLVLVLASRDTTVALDTAIGVTEELHSRHFIDSSNP